MTDVLDDIAAKLAEFRGDPVGFVEWSFTWGEGELANYTGPFAWQRRCLEAVRDGLPLNRAIRLATVSGHGVGKSSFRSRIPLGRKPG